MSAERYNTYFQKLRRSGMLVYTAPAELNLYLIVFSTNISPLQGLSKKVGYIIAALSAVVRETRTTYSFSKS